MLLVEDTVRKGNRDCQKKWAFSATTFYIQQLQRSPHSILSMLLLKCSFCEELGCAEFPYLGPPFFLNALKMWKLFSAHGPTKTVLRHMVCPPLLSIHSCGLISSMKKPDCKDRDHATAFCVLLLSSIVFRT